MNTDLSRYEIFRSSISINSIQPNHNQCEEHDFFRYSKKEEEILPQEVQNLEFVKAIPESQSPLYGSLLDKILFTSHNEPENESNEPNCWVALHDHIGCSESQSEQIQNSDAKKDQLHVPSKSSSFPRSKFYLCHHSSQQGRNSQLLSRRFQNETKNIPKNYGKAIIAYALKNFKKFENLPQFVSITFHDFKKQLVQKRKSINSIAGLKSLWMDFKYAKCMRLLSNEFLRRHSLSYIFNSRISNQSPHVKYRYKLCEAIREPVAFSYIKDY